MTRWRIPPESVGYSSMRRSGEGMGDAPQQFDRAADPRRGSSRERRDGRSDGFVIWSPMVTTRG